MSSQLKLAGLLEPLDTAAVPNVKLVGAAFRTAFPWGIPTDFGKTGFAYRKDLISERPTSWNELFDARAEVLGQDHDDQVRLRHPGVVLQALGYSVNTKVQSAADGDAEALLALKPHLQAILETDYSKALIEGTA